MVYIPFQQRSKVFAVTVVKNNEVFVVAFDERIMSVGPSSVKIRCQVKNIVVAYTIIICRPHGTQTMYIPSSPLMGSQYMNLV